MKAARAEREEVKVVLVGDGGCGKTSLLMVFAEGAFPEVSGSPSGRSGARGLGASFPPTPPPDGLGSCLPAERGLQGHSCSAIGSEGLREIVCQVPRTALPGGVSQGRT